MRGTDYQNDKLFSYVRPDSRVPADHPLRTIRRIPVRPRFDVTATFLGKRNFNRFEVEAGGRLGSRTRPDRPSGLTAAEDSRMRDRWPQPGTR